MCKWSDIISKKNSCAHKRCCCYNAAKSNSFDFTAILQQQKYASATKFGMISTWPIACNTFSKTKRNMAIIFEESLYLFEGRLRLSEERL